MQNMSGSCGMPERDGGGLGVLCRVSRVSRVSRRSSPPQGFLDILGVLGA